MKAAKTSARNKSGLAQVKVMLATLHGKIELDSEPDKGSSFKIILPLKIDNSASS